MSLASLTAELRPMILREVATPTPWPVEPIAITVLAQPEMEWRRFPLVKIPSLRGGDFQGMGSFVPMPYSGC